MVANAARRPDALIDSGLDDGFGFPYIKDLADVGAADLARVGGKAANLGELVRAGFAVPPGFVITTNACDAVVEANGLGEAIAHAVSTTDGAALVAAFESAAVPPRIEDALLAAYRRLGSGAVAVRSSATAEDLPDAAFAGQQETFLGIVDERTLLIAVKRCWASLWSERAVAYRRKRGFANEVVKLAVVVQRLALADSAGVLYTANPVTGARNETVIDASSGLGEAVVAGQVTPDHFLLRRSRWGWRIVAREPGRRETEVRARAGGGTEQITPSPQAGPVLSDAMLRRLADIGVAIAKHFGRPQDVEWAEVDGELFVLQARPITALPAPPRRTRLQPGQFAADYLQVRPYPLDVTTWLQALEGALPRMLPVDGLIPSFDQLWIADDAVVERFRGSPEIRLTPGLLLAPARILVLARRYDPADWRDDPTLTDAEALVRVLEAKDLGALSWNELLTVAHQAMTVPFAVMEVRRRYLPRGALALGGLRLTLAALGRGDRFAALVSGIDNRTLQANRALEEMAAEIRSTPELATVFDQTEPGAVAETLRHSTAGQRFLRRFDAFLDEFGHRETGTPLLVSEPTWKDTPGTVLGILKGMARAKPAPAPNTATWEKARDDVLAHPMFRLPGAREAFLNLLSEARRLLALREDTHFLLTLPLPVLRRTLVELGRRLTAIGVLGTPDEVFHLTFSELERAGAGWPPSGAIVSELRDSARRRAERRAALADVPLMDLRDLGRTALGGDALVAGTPGSPGIAAGPVRVVREAAAFGTLLPGEVLVAPYTNPSWTPLFARAAAVVVDTGSAVSHAAIVAREYGIPAVMGTGDGTRLLRDGQRVRVDGSRGLVFAAELEPLRRTGRPAPDEDAAAGVAVDADRRIVPIRYRDHQNTEKKQDSMASRRPLAKRRREARKLR